MGPIELPRIDGSQDDDPHSTRMQDPNSPSAMGELGQAKIADILQRLQAKPFSDEELQYAARILVHVAGLPKGRTPRGDSAAIRELGELANSLTLVQSSLDCLSAEASVALGQPRDMLQVIAGMKSQVASARELIKARPNRRHAHRPKDLRAYFTTVALLSFYEEFTGRRASMTVDPIKRGHPRSGEFLGLVTEAFQALEISARPAAQVAAAIKRDCSHLFDMEFEELVSILTARETRKGQPRKSP